LQEAEPAGEDHTPYVEGRLVREKVTRQDDFTQAGERYRTFDDWERDDLINNLVGALAPCTKDIQKRMVSMFKKCDEEYGRRVEDGLKMMNAKMMGSEKMTAKKPAKKAAKKAAKKSGKK
jgi:catalase